MRSKLLLSENHSRKKIPERTRVLHIFQMERVCGFAEQLVRSLSEIKLSMSDGDGNSDGEMPTRRLVAN